MGSRRVLWRISLPIVKCGLEPLPEVTVQPKELLFTERGRRAPLNAVVQVIGYLDSGVRMFTRVRNAATLSPRPHPSWPHVVQPH